MRVSRAKADENRRTVIEVASRLFRKHGFDGVGLNALMRGAGLTQGGFYKQFRSKDDLAAQACGKALEGSTADWENVVAASPDDPFRALVRFYLSSGHRDAMGEGCPLAALGSDAARHVPALRRTFEAGINAHLAILDELLSPSADGEARHRSIATLSTMVGALCLSRAVDDRALSESILTAAADSLISTVTASETGDQPVQ